MILVPRKPTHSQVYYYRHRHDSLSTALILLLQALVVSSIQVCEYHKCRPNCVCDVGFDDICAMDYGNYGWDVPQDASDFLYQYMRPESTIRDYEIKPAGMRGRDHRVRGTGEGIAEISSIDEQAIVGQVYFEVHPDRLKDNNIHVQLYGKTLLGLGDCADAGDLLATSDKGGNLFERTDPVLWSQFSSSVFEFPEYNDVFRDSSFECHPRSTNAVMAAAEFTISDPFGDIVGEHLWTSTNNGEILYCIRVNIDPPVMSPGERDDHYMDNFIDTKFSIQGDRDNFGRDVRIEKDVRIFSTKPIESKHAHVLKQDVQVHAFPCTFYDGTEPTMGFPIYTIGQEISICVGPTEDSVEHFEVVGFENVICENSGQSRRIIVNGENDSLTTVGKNSLGYTKVGTNTVDTTPGVLAVTTTVTTGLFQRGDSSMVCSGEALVQSKSLDGHRRLDDRLDGAATSPFQVNVALVKLNSSGSVCRYWRIGLSLLATTVLAMSIGWL